MSDYINQRRKPHGLRGLLARMHRALMVLLVLTGAVGVVAASVGGWQYLVWSRKAAALDYKRLREMESGSLIFDRNSELIGRIFIKNRDEKPLSELSKYLQQAVVSAEDSRFYSHSGVDYFGVLRALSKNLRARRGREGASTLTQQLARNTFTEELPSRDRSIKRKLLEMFVAWEVERLHSKQEILELYLNRVFFGSSFYGAEAAAQGYFGKSAKELTLAESALLAGLLRSPNQLSPWRNRKACIDARNYVLFRMRDLGTISEAAYKAAREEDPLVKNKRSIVQESYAAGMVQAQMAKIVGLESAGSEGYRIYTTIDLSLQRKAEAALLKQMDLVERRPDFQGKPTLAEFDPVYRAWKKRVTAGAEEPAPKPEYLQGAVVALENSSGAIRVLVGGRDVQHSEFNRVSQSKKPPGSAFKPLVYAAGFERGLHPQTVVQDTVMDNRKVMVGGTSGILGEWAREQSDTPYEGLIPCRNALIRSKNAATVRFGMLIADDLKASLEALSSTARTAGIQSPVRAFPASFLGSSELSLLELALAYTTFPGGGSRPAKPYIIERIEDSSGRLIFQESTSREAVLKPGVAFQVHECLSEALSQGTGSKAFTAYGLKNLPFAGKTGTAYDFTDVWFMGYSSELTCGVWAGFDKPRTPIYRGAFGSDLALPIWTEVMTASLPKYPPRQLKKPEDLHRCQICAKSGYAPVGTCQEKDQGGTSVPTTVDAWLTVAQRPLPDETCDVHGPKRARRRRTEEGAQPRVELAMDLSTVTPIALKAPTVLGEDPFNALRSEQAAREIKNFRESGKAAPLDNRTPTATPSTTDGPEPPRVQAVRPGESIQPNSALPSQPALPKLEF
jgi:membrane peptidoglycan carboxypeptidase